MTGTEMAPEPPIGGNPADADSARGGSTDGRGAQPLTGRRSSDRAGIDPDAPIFVAGHRGLVGSAIVRGLQEAGHRNLLTATRDELDLRDQRAVDQWFGQHRPSQVYLAAGTVGGIRVNAERQVEFLRDNSLIHTAVLDAAHRFGVAKLLYLGSACVYPRLAPQPIPESALLGGPLEPTNEGYALAKIAGVRLCAFYRRQFGCNFVSVMPTNLYGPGDNFDLRSSHVVPALIRKFHEAREDGRRAVQIWGTGRARREFLHVDDLADACRFVMAHYDGEEHLNIGTGIEHSIAELAVIVRDLVHPDADLVFDVKQPDGTPRRVLDVSKLTGMGWSARIGLVDGIADTYRWFREARPDRRPDSRMVAASGSAV
jgi:GDP-L-fucose synthase